MERFRFFFIYNLLFLFLISRNKESKCIILFSQKIIQWHSVYGFVWYLALFCTIYAVKVILCCSILADDRCFVLRLLLVFVRSVKFAFGRSVYGQSVKFHMSQYLTTDALAPESQYVPRRVSKLCTCITNQSHFMLFVVF